MDFDRFSKGFFVAWLIGALVSIGFVGVVIWAIIRIVTKYF